LPGVRPAFERLVDALLVCRHDPDPKVANRDLDVPVAFGDIHRDRLTSWRVQRRVAHDVKHRLAQQRGVATGESFTVQDQRMSSAVPTIRLLKHVVGKLAHVDVHGRSEPFAGLELRELR
jgi:hypothetical protein